MMTFNKTLFSLLTFIGCFLGPALLAQEATTPKTIAELTSLLESEMEKQHIAGMTLTVVSKDSVLFVGGLGYADLEKKTPVTERHLFRQASITKLFTALGVLGLVEEGKLSLDSKLKDIAPEVTFQNDWEEAAPITIAQLLEHSTGFDDKTPFEEYNHSGKDFSSLEALQVFEKFMVAKWKPSERHSYSNVNYAVLTYLIEKVSSESFQNYMHAKVFSPLGMPYANVHLTNDADGFYSKGYVWKNGQFHDVPHRPQYSAGNGSLNASAIDFARALQAYLNNWQTPRDQFLSRDMVLRSETPYTYLSAQEGLKSTYALGNESREINGRVFRGHTGTIAGYNSNFQYSRDLGVGFAFSINTFNEGFFWYATDLITRFITQQHPIPIEPKEFPLEETTVKPFLGYYRLNSGADYFTGYFQNLLNTFKLVQHQDGLQANILLGGSMTWKAADSSSLLFTNEWAKDPRILFLYNDEKRPVIVEDTMYFEKISPFKAWAQTVLLLVSLLFMLSSLAFGLVSAILLALRRPINLSTYLLRLLPALATLGLGLSLWAMSKLPAYDMAGLPIDNITVIWRIGKYVFALLALSTLFLFTVRWPYLQNRWLKGYLTIVALSGCYLLGLLVMSNWYTVEI